VLERERGGIEEHDKKERSGEDRHTVGFERAGWDRSLVEVQQSPFLLYQRKDT